MVRMLSSDPVVRMLWCGCCGEDAVVRMLY